MAETERPNTTPKLISFLSCLLQCTAESNDISHPSPSISAFHGLARPTITIHSYLDRIFKYANCSNSCYVVAYIYLHRFTLRHPSSAITPFNVHRLLITAVMLSAKFMDDMYYNNAYYAKIGGISTREMNVLEVDFFIWIGIQFECLPFNFRDLLFLST